MISIGNLDPLNTQEWVSSSLVNLPKKIYESQLEWFTYLILGVLINSLVISLPMLPPAPVMRIVLF